MTARIVRTVAGGPASPKGLRVAREPVDDGAIALHIEQVADDHCEATLRAMQRRILAEPATSADNQERNRAMVTEAIKEAVRHGYRSALVDVTGRSPIGVPAAPQRRKEAR